MTLVPRTEPGEATERLRNAMAATRRKRMQLVGYEKCPNCGHNDGFDFVHSHYQCHHCRNNIVPCCEGG